MKILIVLYFLKFFNGLFYLKAGSLWMMVKDVFSFDYTEAVGDSLKNLCIQSCLFQMV